MAKRSNKTSDVISKEIGIGRQSATLTEVIRLAGYKLKIVIKSDSYDFQSSAAIYVWSGINEGWTRVHSIHFNAMKTPAGLYVRRGDLTTLFAADRAELIRVATEVLA